MCVYCVQEMYEPIADMTLSDEEDDDEGGAGDQDDYVDVVPTAEDQEEYIDVPQLLEVSVCVCVLAYY